MLKVNLKDLRLGMVFSSPLLTESGEHLLKKRVSISKEVVIQWLTSGYNEVYTRGELVGGDVKAEKIVESIQRDILALQSQQQAPEDETTKDLASEQKEAQVEGVEEPVFTSVEEGSGQVQDLPKTVIDIGNIENRLVTLEFIEQIVENLSFGMTQFLQNPLQVDVFREKIVISSERLIKGMKEFPDYMIDIISFSQPGNTLVSHSCRVAILAIYIGLKLDVGYRRLLCLAAASFLHDIGKVGHSIVNDAEGINVSKEKLNINLSHPVYGYKIAKSFLNFQDEVCQAIINHHEQVDGKGFPRRVSDDKLFITDKILYTANIFAHLIEKNRFQGCYQPLTNWEFLVENYTEKFDKKIAGLLYNLKELKSYQALHVPPSPEEAVVNT